MSQQIVLDDQPCTSSSVLKSDREIYQCEAMVENQRNAASPARTHRHRSPSDGRTSSRDKLSSPRLLADLDDLMERLELIHDHRIIQNLYSAGLSAFSFDDEEAATILLTPRAKMDNGQPVLMYLVLNLSDTVKQQHYVSILLSENINVNDRDCEGKTVLMHACIKGYDKIAKSLINHPATDLMLQDRHGNTAFMYAAVHGRLVVLKCFLRILNKIDKTNRYRRQQMAKGCYCPPTPVAVPTPPCLSSSSTAGGAGRAHWSPGDLAGSHSPDHAAKLLLLDSALKFVLHYKNKDGQTALDLSKIHKRKDCQELLDDAEKKVRPASRRTAGGAFNSKFVNKFSSHTFRQKTSQPADADGESPLRRAAHDGDVAVNFRRDGGGDAEYGVGGQSKSLESLCDPESRDPTEGDRRAITENRNRPCSSRYHQELVKKPSIPKWAANKLTKAMGSRRKFEYRWSISSSDEKGAAGGCCRRSPSTIEDERIAPPHRPTTTSRACFMVRRSTTVQEEEQRAAVDVDDQRQILTRKSQSENSAAARCLAESRDSGSIVVGSGRHGRKSGTNNLVQNFIIKIMCRKRSKSRGAAIESVEKIEEQQQKQQNRKKSNNNNSENLLTTEKNEFGSEEKVVVPTLIVQEDSTNFEIWRTRRSDVSSMKNVDFNGSKSFSSESTDESFSLKTPQRVRDFDYHDHQYRNRSSPDSSRSENQQHQETSVVDLDLKIDKIDERQEASKLIVDPKSSDLQPDRRRKSKSILRQFTLDFDKQRSIV